MFTFVDGRSRCRVELADGYERELVPEPFEPWGRDLATLADPQPGERVLDVLPDMLTVAWEQAATVTPPISDARDRTELPVRRHGHMVTPPSPRWLPPALGGCGEVAGARPLASFGLRCGRNGHSIDSEKTVLLRVLIVLLVIGLLLGVVSLTEVGAVLQTVWDWIVNTVTAIVDRFTR